MTTKLAFRGNEGQHLDFTSPKDRDEVAVWLEMFFGLRLSDTACCPEHTAPLDAFSDAYFSKASMTVWFASRGCGKSTMLAGLSALDLLSGANVTVLGGSSRQSQRVHDVEKSVWTRNVNLYGHEVAAPFEHYLDGDPTMYTTKMKAGNNLTALTASQKSVRGPHPEKLRLDEADEMEREVFDAAMGQTVANTEKGIPAQTVISSTRQYPDGTMQYVLKTAPLRGWPIYQFCWRCVRVGNGGWLTDEEIKRKKSEVTEAMWETEYDMLEPNVTGRLLSTETMMKAFTSTHGAALNDQNGRTLEFEAPVDGARYATGADWARDVDMTVIVTIRYDCTPARVVAYERANHEPWGLLTQRFDRRLKRYPSASPSRSGHDAIGVGAVVSDFLEEPAVGFKAVGKNRAEAYSDYILALEKDKLVWPYVVSAFNEHKYVTNEDLFMTAGHPPDTIAAAAIAWRGVLGKLLDKPPGRILSVVPLG